MERSGVAVVMEKKAQENQKKRHRSAIEMLQKGFRRFSLSSELLKLPQSSQYCMKKEQKFEEISVRRGLRRKSTMQAVILRLPECTAGYPLWTQDSLTQRIDSEMLFSSSSKLISTSNGEKRCTQVWVHHLLQTLWAVLQQKNCCCQSKRPAPEVSAALQRTRKKHPCLSNKNTHLWHLEGKKEICSLKPKRKTSPKRCCTTIKPPRSLLLQRKWIHPF